MRFPTKLRFLHSLCISSLSFYLFSFQVHEKTILLPLMPLTLLIIEYPAFVVWFGTVATARFFWFNNIIAIFVIWYLIFWYFDILIFWYFDIWYFDIYIWYLHLIFIYFLCILIFYFILACFLYFNVKV